MKKMLLCVFLILMIISLSVGSCCAGVDELRESVTDFARGIIRNNRPAFECKLTGKDLLYSIGEYDTRAKSGSNRVWAKGKTIVLGTYLADSNFVDSVCMEYFATADPNYIFAGGIHVGSSIKDLERYLNAPVNKFNEIWDFGVEIKNGYISFCSYDVPADTYLTIFHSNGKISQISFSCDAIGNITPKTKAFIKSQKKSMGLR